MELIETITVGSGGAASIEFTSIPQDADDLLLVVSDRTTESSTDSSVILKTNGNSPTGKTLRGDGSSVSSANALFNTATGATATANTFSNSQYYFPNYAGSSAKSVSAETVTENNATRARQTIGAGSYSSTSAITSIELSISGGHNFVQYSTASLYKVKKA